jgi:hypothetical protein
MSGVTIGASLNNGFAGTYAQQPDSIIDTHPIVASGTAVPFGHAVIDASNGAVKKADATMTAANFVGIAVREVKTVLSYTDPNAGGEYVAEEAASILKRGMVSVICQDGTPSARAKVFLRITANESKPAALIGGLETTADSGKCLEITNARWAGTKDANGIAAIRLLTINL